MPTDKHAGARYMKRPRKKAPLAPPSRPPPGFQWEVKGCAVFAD